MLLPLTLLTFSIDAMSRPLFQPGSEFLGSGPADLICKKNHEKWWDDHYKPPYFLPPVIAHKAQRINLFKASFFCRDIMSWSIWIAQPKAKVGPVWQSGKYIMTCDSQNESLVIVEDVWVEVLPVYKVNSNLPDVSTDRAYCVPNPWKAQIEVPIGDEQCLDFPPLPGTSVTLVAWTTNKGLNGLEEQVTVGRFTIKRNLGVQSEESGHYPMLRLTISTKSSFEHKIEERGFKGEVWQVCVDNPRIRLRQHSFVTLHNAMVPAKLNDYLNTLEP